MPKDLIKADPEKVNANTGELIVDTTPTREEIAGKLSSFLDSKEKKIFFNGKRYAEFSDFQFIGSFYGITVKTFDPHFVEVGGHRGFHAKAMLLRDQMEVGRAEAYCMDDEVNWRNKPLFQLASMAQTRAAAKAYSNLFRPIVHLAGIEGTPAEEMDGADQPALQGRKVEEARIKELAARVFHAPPTPQEVDEGEEDMTEEVAAKPGITELENIHDQIPFPPAAQESKGKTISKKQQGLLFFKAKQANISEKTMKVYIKEHYGVDHSADLPWQAMTPTLKWIENHQGQ